MSGSNLKEVTISEFFLKNKHQLGFGAPARATLTAVKEAVDNSLDACEEHGILPDILVEISTVEKKNSSTDVIKLLISDNGPGIRKEDLGQVFARLLVGSKFHANRQQRGQQGIGIAAAGMYALTTTASPVTALSAQKGASATRQVLKLNTKNNQPEILESEDVKPEFHHGQDHGTVVELILEGKMMNGDKSVETFLRNTAVVNPHCSLKYVLEGVVVIDLKRTVDVAPELSKSVLPHPHSIQLGEFLSILRSKDNRALNLVLKTSFSRLTAGNIASIDKKLLNKAVGGLSDGELKTIFQSIKDLKLMAPQTDILSPISQEGLAKGVQRLQDIEYVEVVSRKPTVCQNSAFQVEVAIASVKRPVRSDNGVNYVQVLRFANKVPLQFQFSADVITKTIKKIDWKSYGMPQSKNNLPEGNYIFIVSVVGSWLPFTNAAKEAIDDVPGLSDEIRLALQEAGRKVAIHIKRKRKALDAEARNRSILKYAPHVIEGIKDILKLSDAEKKALSTALEATLTSQKEVQEESPAEEPEIETETTES